MSEFVCPQCGESHEGDPVDFGWSLPDEVWDIPSSEREALAKYNSDLCEYGSRVFFRSLLMIPFKDRGGYFGWGIWVEVEREVFNSYLKVYETDGSNEPLVEGKIANAIPGYEDSLHTLVQIQFGPSDQRPISEIVGESGTKIGQHQENGIDAAQYHQILEDIAAR